MSDFQEIEQVLLDRYGGTQALEQAPIVFLLAPPRCGSTLLYQLLIHDFDFFYFSNFINDRFAACPIVGTAIALAAGPEPVFLDLKSNYGKTRGALGASEASGIFRNWFGGEHPSQVCSAKLLDGKEQHIRQTMAGITAMTGKALITKNAWNCFRVQELSRLFPRSLFLWLRRDIRCSAISDLEARYHHGGATVWNSATPSDVDEIRKRPYWEQVVEQQYAYHTTLASDLSKYVAGRACTQWYEACCDRTGDVIRDIEQFFAVHGFPVHRRNTSIPELRRSHGPDGMLEDREKVIDYAHSQRDRLREMFYDETLSCTS